MAGRVTIADLARSLGVSKASVSYALNGRPGVSDETRARILAHAAELGWYPSSSARALSRSRTGVVGVVLSRDPALIGTEPYYMRVIAGIESVLAEADSGLLLRMVGPHPDHELEVYRRWAGERRVDGVILFDERVDDARVDLLERLGLPAVLRGGPVDSTHVGCVVSDDAADARLLVEHLAAVGHRRVLLVSGPTVLRHERRRRALLAELGAAAGLEVEHAAGDYGTAAARALVGRRLAEPEPPTAVVTANDVMALGALAAAGDVGVAVPGALAVASWDDSVLCELGHPPVTALDRDPLEAGRACAQVLLRQVAGGEAERVAVSPSVLRVRESTAVRPR